MKKYMEVETKVLEQITPGVSDIDRQIPTKKKKVNARASATKVTQQDIASVSKLQQSITHPFDLSADDLADLKSQFPEFKNPKKVTSEYKIQGITVPRLKELLIQKLP